MCIRDSYKVDEALSKCKKELDKDEKARVKADLANLRHCPVSYTHLLIMPILERMMVISGISNTQPKMMNMVRQRLT